MRSNQTTYIGRTADLKRRWKEHKYGKCRSTRATNPRLVYYEAYNNKRDSISHEAYLKTGNGRHALQKQLKHTLQGPIV